MHRIYNLLDVSTKTHLFTSDDRALILALQFEIGGEALPNSPDLNLVFYLESTPTACLLYSSHSRR